jgi:hypothetical protein
VCKYLDSDVIVGNALIRQAKKQQRVGIPQISFEVILEFEKTVSARLEREDCYVRFSRDPIAEFEIDYPFFVSRLSLEEPEKWEIKVDRISALCRYFRDGLPSNLASVFEEFDRDDCVPVSTST